jgi:putative hemolysin
MPVDEFADLLSIPIPDIRGYHTVAGFVLQDFGTLPEVGHNFERDGWRFEVVDMDGRRVDKVLAMRIEAEAARQVAQQQEASLKNGERKKSAQAR